MLTALCGPPRPRDPIDTAVAWLAAGHPDPDRMRDEWKREHGIALLAVGKSWDAIKITCPEVVATAHAVAEATLVAGSGKPVLLSTRALYIPIDLGSAAGLDIPGLTVLRRGAWIAAPKPGADAYSPVRWLTLPDGSDQFMDARRLYATCQCCNRRTVRAV